jgi:predicted cupin superfamily sugar epimerase
MNFFSVPQLIQQFNLLPHPEGGYYKETYRSKEAVAQNALPKGFSGDRSFSTAIYFLLEKGNFSAFHKIKSDECWHFYAGQTLNVYVINSNDELEIIKLGNDIASGETFQYVVPANCWFASEPAVNTEFSFVGCTVAPGFDFADFELAKADELIKLYPQHEETIRRLCR